MRALAALAVANAVFVVCCCCCRWCSRWLAKRPARGRRPGAASITPTRPPGALSEDVPIPGWCGRCYGGPCASIALAVALLRWDPDDQEILWQAGHIRHPRPAAASRRHRCQQVWTVLTEALAAHGYRVWPAAAPGAGRAARRRGGHDRHRPRAPVVLLDLADLARYGPCQAGGRQVDRLDLCSATPAIARRWPHRRGSRCSRHSSTWATSLIGLLLPPCGCSEPWVVTTSSNPHHRGKVSRSTRSPGGIRWSAYAQTKLANLLFMASWAAGRQPGMPLVWWAVIRLCGHPSSDRAAQGGWATRSSPASEAWPWPSATGPQREMTQPSPAAVSCAAIRN